MAMSIVHASETTSLREDVPTREGYDRWAETYDTEDNPLILLEGARVRDLLGNIQGLQVADLGCGTGRHTFWLTENGAYVTAVDFSPRMIAKARRKDSRQQVRFISHDLSMPLPFPEGSFDVIVCCLVTEHIAALGAFFCELRRVSRTTGLVLLSMMHPALAEKGLTARFIDPQTGHEVRPLSFAHSVADYIAAADQGGLTLERLSEHTVGGDLAARSPRATKYLGTPLLLIMQFRHFHWPCEARGRTLTSSRLSSRGATR